MILLSGLIFILLAKPGRCLEEDGGFTFNGDVRHFAVANNSVYVATDDRLYQLNHDLTLVRSLTQRGILKDDKQLNVPRFHRVSEKDEWNATFSVNVLLPFDGNDTLISCGVTDDRCGYCEVLDLADISKVRYSEPVLVGPVNPNSASVAFLVDVETSRTTDTYILTAIQQDGSPKPTCSSGSEAVFLHNTNNNQPGEIFSFYEGTIPLFKSNGYVDFVDGFQISSIIYLFSNVPSDKEVRLIWLEGKTSKVQTMKTLRGASLYISDLGGKGSRLLASSVVPGGPPVLWSGVFSVDGGQTNTELVMFDISPDLSLKEDEDPDFCSAVKCEDKNVQVGRCISKTLLHLLALNQCQSLKD